jgi:UDP-2,3-diacylglucosamine hydrolase
MAPQFVSDLHLDPARPAATDCFLRFLAGPARDGDQLFILGDLFEAWLGDDAADDHAGTVMAALQDYSASGRALGFLPGNRDFLIGPAFAAATGATLLADEALTAVAGRRALLMHGDTLCTGDAAYQRYRAVVHRPAVRRAFLALPAALRRRLARYLRSRSRAANASKPAAIMDVTPAAVDDAMDRHGVDLLIHGHTHRPAVHRPAVAGGRGTRVVLGAWHEAGSVLRFAGSEPELVTLPFG